MVDEPLEPQFMRTTPALIYFVSAVPIRILAVAQEAPRESFK